MLGVLKRRWKPKRSSNSSNNRISINDPVNCTVTASDIILEKPASRLTHQVHPVCDEKAQLLAYENNIKPINPPNSLPVAPLQTCTPTTNNYPLTPNICVEGGRIEFIKTPPPPSTTAALDTTNSSFNDCDSLSCHSTAPPSPTDLNTSGGQLRSSSSIIRFYSDNGNELLTKTGASFHKRRSTASTCTNNQQQSVELISRSQQTLDFIEKYDIEKECLEQRILDLEMALEQEHKINQKDKMTITKLQRQLARRESVQRDAERERKLRTETEVRMREVGAEATRYRTRLKFLTQEFAKMEESVRAMLAYKSRAEQLKQEKASLTLAFEARAQQYQATIARLSQEITVLRQQLDTSLAGSQPDSCIAALEANNATLQREVQEARQQYERCLDDVANQVVRALLSQKTLREEIGALTRRIRELETQNRALTSLLVQQLRTGSTPSSAMITPNSSPASGEHQFTTDNHDFTQQHIVKHSNSFNFDGRKSSIDKRYSTGDLISSYNEKLLPNGELVACISEKRLSANVLDSCEDNSLSLEDKKRHQILCELWKELQGAEVTPQKLLKALSALETSLWSSNAVPNTNSGCANVVQPKRPVTLNLAIPNTINLVNNNSSNLQKNVSRSVIIAPIVANKPEEEAGSESPESGNRDEGYSTMSSDVQGDVNRSQSEPNNRGLEDLAEATDETADSENRFIVVEDRSDPDILYIPINLALHLNPRNSYPPSKDLLPFQHVMRSFSDSHLCIKITTAPSPCYSISSPITSTPSVVLLDVNPLRRTKANSTLAPSTDATSWGSNFDLDHQWDSEYIQHWLKLDETRSNLQQQHRDLLELEYDRAELEDWSLSLSTEDVREAQIEVVQTPGQVSIATLPSIQEGSTIELEEDSNECLWNDSSYLTDRTGGEAEVSWPYATSHDITSPPESWSSVSEDDPCSKRSSAAMSDEAPLVDTNFTRDFYRLVKFESTKSLASCSSRGGCENDRDQTLQNVLNFIAEQQMYCTEYRSDSRPSSARDFNIEAPPQPQSRFDEMIWSSDSQCTSSDAAAVPNQFSKSDSFSDSENYVNFKHLCNEMALNEQNRCRQSPGVIPDCIVNAVNVSTNGSAENSNSLDVNCKVSSSNNKIGKETHLTIDKSLSKIQSNTTELKPQPDIVATNSTTPTQINDDKRSSLIPVPEEEENTSPPTTLTESYTSSVSTPDTIVSRIPRRQTKSHIPTKTTKKSVTSPIKSTKSQSEVLKRPVKSRIPYKHQSTVVQLVKKESSTESPVITSERLPQLNSGTCSNIIEGPPERAISFHERATSKDVIDELNRIIRNDNSADIDDKVNSSGEIDKNGKKLDSFCYPTGWVHVEKDIDFTDPKARANLLDVMLASSDSSPTSSCGGSVSSESNDDRTGYKHLHKIHRYRRQKKVTSARLTCTNDSIAPPVHMMVAAVINASMSSSRPSIIGRDNLFVRYGEKEREAVASFDFLQEYTSALDQNDEQHVCTTINENDEDQQCTSTNFNEKTVTKQQQICENG